MNLIILILGFMTLVKGADMFVEASASIARRFHIPNMIIGLTLVAFGTSAPELAVNINASLSGSNGLVFGNVVGSNIINLLLILGLSSFISPINIRLKTLYKEMPFSLLISLVLLLVSFGGTENNLGYISSSEGIILLLFFLIYFYSLIESVLSNKYELNDTAESKIMSLKKSIIFSLLGLGGIILGGNLTVSSAVNIASLLGLSEAFIGLTIIAIGTSLPELMTSIVAAKKGENEIAVGNIVGSNIFNILLVLGLSASIHPIKLLEENLIDIYFLIFGVLLTWIFMFTGKKISKFEGLILFLTYLSYLGFLLLNI